MKYKLICQNNPSNLEKLVNELLDKGWKLSGSHQMTDNEQSQYFSQALTYDDSLDVPTKSHIYNDFI